MIRFRLSFKAHKQHWQHNSNNYAFNFFFDMFMRLFIYFF